MLAYIRYNIPDALSVTLAQCETVHTINSAVRPEIRQRFSHTTQSPLSFLFLIYGVHCPSLWLQQPDMALAASRVDKQEGGRSQFTS